MTTKNDVHKLAAVYGEHYNDKKIYLVINIASVKMLLRRIRYLHLRLKDIKSKCNILTKVPV